MQIRNKISNKTILTLYLNIIRPLGYFLSLLWIEKIKLAYRKYINNVKYGYLNKYKNKNICERCFIIGTGPSLSKEDYKKLNGEITIGVNALCLWFNELKPSTYFFVSDNKAYEKLKNNIPKGAFISEKCLCKDFVNYNIFPISRYNDFFSWDRKYSRDFSVMSFDANTVIVHAIQFAIFTGIREIYLLGVDCNYQGKQIYSIDHGVRRYSYAERIEADRKMIVDLIGIKKFAEKNHVKIFNASKNSKLEVFEKVNLDKLFFLVNNGDV